MINRLLKSQLPDFARPDHPFMRYNLLRHRPTPVARRILQILFILIFAGVGVFAGWQLATNGGTQPKALETHYPLDAVFLVLYLPLVVLQLFLRISALSANIGAIITESQRGTWDTLKITTGGAGLLMKTRWAAIFYRLWFMLAVVVGARVFFIVVALGNLADFQGRHLDLLLSGTIPFGPPHVAEEVSVVIGIAVTAMMFTAALLSPFTSVAFDAALGMLLGTVARGRLVGTLGQLLLIALRVILTGLTIWIMIQALSIPIAGTGTAAGPLSTYSDSNVVNWLSAFAGVVEGDLGLTLLYVDRIQNLWADVEYGVLIGVAALGYVLLQAFVANLLVLWAGRRATRADSV